MTQLSSPFDPAALQRPVPRYTSYPTAPHFAAELGGRVYEGWLDVLAPAAPLSLYVHVPFCDELCWFCACRTQGSKRYEQVTRYLGCLETEIRRVADRLGTDHPIAHIHWGGGSPTILSPEDLLHLRALMHELFPQDTGVDFAVEIDPRDITPARLDAFGAAGITRASIGVQDFDPGVQRAIGRLQGREMTRDVIAGLRGHGVGSINIDLLYGLPGQTQDSLARTIEGVIALDPDRLAIFGYAHVPWMARRQKMIDASTLPGSAERRLQAALARQLLIEAGYVPVGIDHFARPGDAMAEAAAAGTLRRNFQGYTVDPAEALIGFGASAIGWLPQGYAQNEAVTADYQNRVEAGAIPVKKGYALTLEDRVRRDAIEQLLCHFRLDLGRLRARYGDFSGGVRETAEGLMAIAPEGALIPLEDGFEIAEDWREHTRPVAAEFDSFFRASPARHSLAV